MNTCMKLSTLEQCLQEAKTFEKPKVNLEQYPTTPHLAACMLYTIQSTFGDIKDKLIADLGCGCGVLSLGATLLEAAHCIGFDIDPDALHIFSENVQDFEVENCEAILSDIKHIDPKWNKVFDTVIMNPPFGTRCKGIDIEFIEVGMKLSNLVYSLHKTSTRPYVMKKAKELGLKCTILAEMRFDLSATYKFHNKKSVDINVDFYQFKCI